MACAADPVYLPLPCEEADATVHGVLYVFESLSAAGFSIRAVIVEGCGGLETELRSGTEVTALLLDVPIQSLGLRPGHLELSAKGAASRRLPCAPWRQTVRAGDAWGPVQDGGLPLPAPAREMYLPELDGVACARSNPCGSWCRATTRCGARERCAPDCVLAGVAEATCEEATARAPAIYFGNDPEPTTPTAVLRIGETLFGRVLHLGLSNHEGCLEVKGLPREQTNGEGSCQDLSVFRRIESGAGVDNHPTGWWYIDGEWHVKFAPVGETFPVGTYFATARNSVTGALGYGAFSVSDQ